MQKYMKQMSQREKDSYMMIDMEKGSSKKLLKSQEKRTLKMKVI